VNAGVHRARRAYAPTRRRIARQGHICVRDACAMSFQRSGIKRENLVRSRNNRDTHGVARLVFSVVSHPPTPGETWHRGRCRCLVTRLHPNAEFVSCRALKLCCLLPNTVPGMFLERIEDLYRVLNRVPVLYGTANPVCEWGLPERESGLDTHLAAFTPHCAKTKRDRRIFSLGDIHSFDTQSATHLSFSHAESRDAW